MRGVWIEIADFAVKLQADVGHSPCGECGLKSKADKEGLDLRPSLPMRGVWIEMAGYAGMRERIRSLPMRGVWIEISLAARRLPRPTVTPHAGSVD